MEVKDLEGKIINADCMDILKQLPDKCIDLVLTDPPYRDSKDNQPTMDMRNNGTMKNFGDKPSKEMFNELFRISKKQIIFGANNFELPPFKGFLVWDKQMPFNFTMSMAEIAWISEKVGTISKIFSVRANGQEYRIHPTQKPLQLFEKILQEYAGGGRPYFRSVFRLRYYRNSLPPIKTPLYLHRKRPGVLGQKCRAVKGRTSAVATILGPTRKRLNA